MSNFLIPTFPVPTRANSFETGNSDRISDHETHLRQHAEDFESVFIAEMLSHSGLDKAISNGSGFGGDAFSRLLVDTYADALTKQGGFGLAEKIFNQLKSDEA